MELSGSQKRHLRSLANRMPVAMTLGKAGLTEGVAGALKALFARQELIKVRLPAGPPPDREALAEELARSAGAVVAGSVGRTTLLYKPNETLPAEKQIRLPG